MFPWEENTSIGINRVRDFQPNVCPGGSWESHSHVVYNGSASRINEIGLQLYPVSEYDCGESLPYAPVDWPNAGDKWGSRVGKRVKSSGTFRDRYLYLSKHFKAPKKWKEK
ncbi:hypothetical protein KY284_036364 [Solanum tuberosum]|nr:hypothetical protein KY284_036364 [Solanum tuberosum]